VALCYAARRPSADRKELFFLLTRHLFLIPARRDSENVPGYYRSSLAGLEYRGRELGRISSTE
jgi:hypothetical protein